jgi:hypothetical protein
VVHAALVKSATFLRCSIWRQTPDNLVQDRAGLGVPPLDNTTRGRDAPRSRPATTENNTAQPPPDNTKGDHKTEDQWGGVDDEAIAFWDDTCAAMPPLSPATIEAISIIVRRIDQRRTQR